MLIFQKHTFFYRYTLQVFVMLLATLYSCQPELDQSQRVQTLDFELDEEESMQEILKKLDKDFPAPVDFVGPLQKASISFYPSLLPLDTAQFDNNMVTASIQLGVSLSDLAYCTLFFQSKKIKQYFGRSKKIADKLNIINAQHKILEQRYQSNIANKDSLLNLSREQYFLIDHHLKNHNRTEVALQILVGYWVETLYLTTQSIIKAKSKKEVKKQEAEDDKDDKEKKEKEVKKENLIPLIKSVGAQKPSIPRLIQIFDKSKNPKIKTLVRQLKELKKIYEDVETVPTDSSEPNTITAIQINDLQHIRDQSVLRSTLQVKINTDTFKKITKQISLIRQQLIK